MYTNYPFGVCLAHNGNLTNVDQLRERVFAEARHINTDSVRAILDVELVLCTWHFGEPLLPCFLGWCVSSWVALAGVLYGVIDSRLSMDRIGQV